jgi:hypothetical protein
MGVDPWPSPMGSNDSGLGPFSPCASLTQRGAMMRRRSGATGGSVTRGDAHQARPHEHLRISWLTTWPSPAESTANTRPITRRCYWRRLTRLILMLMSRSEYGIDVRSE